MQKQRYDCRLSVVISQQQKQFIDNSGFDQSNYVRNAIDFYADLLANDEETLNKKKSDLSKEIENINKQLELRKKLDAERNEEIKEQNTRINKKYEEIKPHIANHIEIDGFENTIRNTNYIKLQSEYVGIDEKKLIEMFERDFSQCKNNK